jgi:hypothetical protein
MRGGAVRILAALAWALTMLPMAATAQGADPAADAVFRTGPLAFTPSLSIPALGLDSNVFNDSENARQDFTANIQPAVDAWLRLGRLRVDARQQFNLLYFRKYASERAVNTNSTMRAQFELLWATPYVSAAFVRTNDRADARIDTRAVNRNRPVSAGIDFRLSSSTNLDLGINDNRVSFEDDATFDGTSLQSALDRSTRAYRGTLRYAFSPPTALTLTVSRQEERFRFSPRQNSRSVRVLPGLSLAADALLTGRAEVGWMVFEPQVSGVLRRFTGVVANVDVGYVFLGLTRLQFALNRDVTPSIDSLSSYALQTGITGTITHRVSERWDVNASARRVRMDFGQVSVRAGEAATIDRADTVLTYAGGIGFYFTQGLRIGFRTESIRRRSVEPRNRYDNLRILTSISYDLN